MGDANDNLPEDDQPPDSAPTSTNFDGEDFLFHLYRGSELLQDNCIAEAKEELERALGMQPKDAEGQALLGVVYFRLGLYPRAIGIYEELLRSFPTELTPRMNLAVCYLKTGQYAEARQMLEEVVRRDPDHRRAWGYLGLVFERASDFGKAKAAFERAGQTAMALRMDRQLPQEQPLDPDRAHLRQAAADAVREIELDPTPFTHAQPSVALASAPTGSWQAREPGRAPAGQLTPRPATAAAHVSSPTPMEMAERIALPAPPQGVELCGERLVVVRVREELTVRSSSVRALIPDGDGFRTAPAYRRARGRQLDEPLGGLDSALARLEGAGQVVLGASEPGSHLLALRLVAGELLYLREDFLVGFEGGLRHESGRLARGESGQYPMVQFGGEGIVIIETATALRSLVIGSGGPVMVTDACIVGWTGRLLPQSPPADALAGGRGYLGFTGTGSLFLLLD